MKMLVVLVVLLRVSQHASGVEVFDDEESVQLPCLVKVSILMESMVVWSREDLKSSIVHIRYQSSDDLMDQNKRYRNRTWMREDALHTGDLSLTLRNPKIPDSETYTCTVRRFGMELNQTDVDLKVTERPPVWPKVLIGVLVPLVLLASVFGFGFWLYRRRKYNPGSQVEVDSGVESVLLTCKTTFELPENAKVEWKDHKDKKVHVHQNGSDLPEKQHWWYKGRTEMNKDLLKTGDLSLTLKHPTDRDSCTFTCTINNMEIKEVELRVKVPQVDLEEGAEFVQLPCRFRGQLPPDVTVEWTYVDIWTTKVHVFQNGSDQQEEQHQWFRDRTEMKGDLLVSGDLSLTLKHPTDRDNDTYTCTVYDREGTILMKKQVEMRVKD